MQIISPSFGGQRWAIERAHGTDYLLDADQNIPGGLTKVLFWGRLKLPLKVNVKSEAAQSCPTLSDPVNCSLPGSSIHGVFPARVLEWVAISFSRGSS